MALLKLAPCFKDYLWGGRRLVEMSQMRTAIYHYNTKRIIPKL